MIVDRLEHPIVQAPMAGGPSTPELAAAVSGAGGLGFLAAGYRSAEQLAADIDELRAATDAPFGVNVFVPGDQTIDEAEIDRYASEISPEAQRLGTVLGEPAADTDDWKSKLNVLTKEGVPVVSFTFGTPGPREIKYLKRAGSEVWVTVTDVGEALMAEAAGADALIVQGSEAGGHRGSFIDRDGAEPLGLLVLLRLVAREVEIPLIASGGLADGAAVAGVLAAGARAAQLGTAFMLTSEAGTDPEHRRALTTRRPTGFTRAFTGRLARGLRNRFFDQHSAGAPRAYPQVHQLTAPIRAAAREQGDADSFNLWAGQAHQSAPEMRAADLTRRLGLDAQSALQEAGERIAESLRPA